MALVKWRNDLEKDDNQHRIQLDEHCLPNEINYLSRMHREICGISDLNHVIDALDLMLRY